MNNPFSIIIDDGTVDDALDVAASLSTEELERKGEGLSSSDFLILNEWTLTNLPTLLVQSLLYLGGMILLYRAATRKEDRKEFFENLIKDLQISKSKAYSSVAVFGAFAALLLNKRHLMPKFRTEALRRLSAKNAPVAAREQAVQEASTGAMITEARAEAILEQHGFYEELDQRDHDCLEAETPVTQPEERGSVPMAAQNLQKSVRRSTKKHASKRRFVKTREVWKFKDGDTWVIIKSDQTDVPPNILAMKVLEAAQQRCREELAETEVNSQGVSEQEVLGNV